MPRKASIRQPPSATACGGTGATAATGPTAGWSYTGFFSTAPLSLFGGTGRAVYTEPTARTIHAVRIMGAIGPATGTASVAVVASQTPELAGGVRLTFRTPTGPVITGSVWHATPAQFDLLGDPDPYTAPTASPWPSLVRTAWEQDLFSRRFFLPELELDAPGGPPVRKHLPTAEYVSASTVAVVSPDCPAGAGAGSDPLAVGHVRAFDNLAETVNTTFNFGANPGMATDLRLFGFPYTITPPTGTSGPTGTRGHGAYIDQLPTEATLWLWLRTNAGQYGLAAAPYVSARKGLRVHYLDPDRATGAVTLAWLTGPTGSTGPTAPWSPTWRITGTLPSGPVTSRDRLAVTITPPTGEGLPPGNAGAYRLRVEAGLTIPYDATPYFPPYVKPTPTGNMPTAPWLIYPLELAFVVDPTAPAAITSSPPSASSEPVRTLAVAASETCPTISNAGTEFKPYTLTRDNVPLPFGYRFWPGSPPGSAAQLEFFGTTAPGRYALTPSASGVFRDQAGLANLAPWNPVTWETVATGTTAPAAGSLQQFPRRLEAAPSGVALSFTEPVTGVTPQALAVFVDGTAFAHQATLTGTGRFYQLDNLAAAFDAGWAVWLELGTTGIRTVSGARTPAGPIRSAWVKSAEPPAMPDHFQYGFPTGLVGPSHFGLWRPTTPPPATGPVYAGAILHPGTGEPQFRYYTVAASSDDVQADTLAPPACASGATAPDHLLTYAYISGAYRVSCPPARTNTTFSPSPAPRPAILTPAADTRHANYAPPPTEIPSLTVTIDAEDYRQGPYYAPNEEYIDDLMLAEVWPVYTIQGAYQLDNLDAANVPLAPGLYHADLAGGGPPMTITPDPNAGAEWTLAFGRASGQPAPDNYEGDGQGPLPEQIVDEFLEAGGMGGSIITLESTRIPANRVAVRWTITADAVQAWASVSREFPDTTNQCNQPIAMAGGLRINLLVRATYTLEAQGRPLDTITQYRYVRTVGDWLDIETRPRFEFRDTEPVNRTYYRARHHGLAVLLSPAEATAWLAGEPLTRRVLLNAMYTTDGVSSAYYDVGPWFPPTDDLAEPTGTTGAVYPACWYELTITANPT